MRIRKIDLNNFEQFNKLPIEDKLKTAWSYKLNDTQTCALCGLSMNELKEIYEDNPDLIDEARTLRENVKVLSKINITNAVMEGDLDTSKWTAERLMKEEFSTKQIVEEEGSQIEKKEQLMDLEIEKFKQDILGKKECND